MEQKTLDIILTRVARNLEIKDSAVRGYVKKTNNAKKLETILTAVNYTIRELETLLDTSYSGRTYTTLTDCETGISYFGYYKGEKKPFNAILVNYYGINPAMDSWCQLPKEKPITAKYAC